MGDSRRPRRGAASSEPGLSAAKQAATTGAEHGLKSAAKAGARKAASGAARVATKPGGSLFVRLAGQTVGYAAVVERHAVKPAVRTAFAAFQAARRQAGSLSPAQAKLVARGVLAVGLGVTLRYKTFPAVAAWYVRQLDDLGPLLEGAGTPARLANEVAGGLPTPLSG